MDGQSIPRRAMKRRRVYSSLNQIRKKAKILRKTVDISGDTWLETLKFLTCLQWSQKRFISRQINRVAKYNISCLPKMVLDSADMYYINGGRTQAVKKLLSKYTIVLSDTVMQEKQSSQWFKDRDFTLDAPEDISAENAIIGAQTWKRIYKSNVHICIQGPAQVKVLISKKDTHFPWFTDVLYRGEIRKSVFYFAQFNPLLNQHSWAYLAQFLRFVYHPVSYIKDVKMFAVNLNFIDSLKRNIDSFENKPLYICCESFSLKGIQDITDTNTADLSNSLNWMARDVRAETIRIPGINCNAGFAVLANFLLDVSGAKQCASKKIKIRVSPIIFLNILIEKFRTISLFEGATPTIVFSYPAREEYRAHLGPNLIDREVDSEGSDALYMILNGQNRMRISFSNNDFNSDDESDESEDHSGGAWCRDKSEEQSDGAKESSFNAGRWNGHGFEFAQNEFLFG